MFLEGGVFYHFKVFHFAATDANYVVLGVTLPNGAELRPIPSEYFWIEKPGKIIYGIQP